MPVRTQPQYLTRALIACLALLSMLLGMLSFQGVASATPGTAKPSSQPTCHPLCYRPQQIYRAYDIKPLLDRGINGRGRTIVIIGAFQSPTMQHDLHAFDRMFGLNTPMLRIIAPDGLTPFNPKDPVQTSFAGEITLDVEWAHAIAPRATIDLVLGNPASDTPESLFAAVLRATQFAIEQNLGDVMSMSFGGAETCVPSAIVRAEHQAFEEARRKQITVLAIAGDNGAFEPLCNASGAPIAPGPGVEYPGSDPLVTTVGGTTLFADDKTGTYDHETAWNDQISFPNSRFGGATGGGISRIFARPKYQAGVPGLTAFRGLPDVAYNADSNTGMLVVCSVCGAGADAVIPAGGTSAGAPQWAGIVALADQHAGRRLGFLNDALYRIGERARSVRAYHDITTGNNTVTVLFQGRQVKVNGYAAHSGWDAVTGWGTPDVARLVPLLTGRL